MKEVFKAYAGIGDFDAPNEILEAMQSIASELEELGYVLRSRGDEGVDEAMIEGVVEDKNLELFLPIKGYNDFESRYSKPAIGAYEHAWKYHNDWQNQDEDTRRLLASGVHTLMGADLKTPSLFLICYTVENGEQTETDHAITIADSMLIPVFNFALGIDYTFNQIENWMNENA